MTPFQLRALDFVRDRITELGFSPTVTEIARHLGVSYASAHQAISALVRGGSLEREPHKQRGLRMPGTIDLRQAATTDLRLELARRGVTLESLAPAPRLAFDRKTTCASYFCGELVPRGHLFCKRHWFTLPRGLRDSLVKACIVDRDEIAFEQAMTRAHDVIERRAA